MTTITLDPNYGYVLVAAASTFVLNTVHGNNTYNYRKAAKVDYPATYAPDSRTDLPAIQFNSAQRAHVNFTENYPTFLTAMLLTGLKFPLTASILGALWIYSRYVYMRGYSSGEANGKGRYRNGAMLHYVSLIGCMGLTAYSGVAMVMGW